MTIDNQRLYYNHDLINGHWSCSIPIAGLLSPSHPGGCSGGSTCRVPQKRHGHPPRSNGMVGKEVECRKKELVGNERKPRQVTKRNDASFLLRRT